MSNRQFDTEAPLAAKSNPESTALDSEITAAADYAPRLQGGWSAGSPLPPEAQATALTQASGGQLVRAGNALLQLQRDYGNRYVQRVVSHAQQSTSSNRTGLPDQLKAGIESLSGISLDDVKVHYNSSQPAQLNALAYAQGSDIHIAPGQERHLPHEAWHLVQQAQGRVKPTMQLKREIPVNDDAGLEHEADVMGAQAMQKQGIGHTAADRFTRVAVQQQPTEVNVRHNASSIVQRLVFIDKKGDDKTQDYEKRAVDQPFGLPANKLVDYNVFSSNRNISGYLEDGIVRRFKSEDELEDYAADGKAEHAGLIKEGAYQGTWIRVDKFIVLGESHNEPYTKQIIRALGTHKWRWEGFKQYPVGSPRFERLTGEQENAYIGEEKFFEEMVRGKRHDVENSLNFFARASADDLQSHLNAVSEDNNAYSLPRAVVETVKDSLDYLTVLQQERIVDGAHRGLFDFARSNIGKIWLYSKVLNSFLGGNPKPIYEYVSRRRSFQDFFPRMANVFHEAAFPKDSDAESELANFRKRRKIINSAAVQSLDAVKFELARDFSMLKTIEESQHTDLLFIIGGEHSARLGGDISNKGIKVSTTKDFLKAEQLKNMKLKHRRADGDTEDGDSSD